MQLHLAAACGGFSYHHRSNHVEPIEGVLGKPIQTRTVCAVFYPHHLHHIEPIEDVLVGARPNSLSVLQGKWAGTEGRGLWPAQMLPGDHIRLQPLDVAPGFDSPAAEVALQVALAGHMVKHPGRMHMGSGVGAFLHQIGVEVRSCC